MEGALDATTLAAVEDRLCAFLQIPELLRPAPRPAPPLGDATRYAAWSEVYRAGPEVDGDRQRRIVDMVAIARGLAVTHGLEAAVGRAGTSLH